MEVPGEAEEDCKGAIIHYITLHKEYIDGSWEERMVVRAENEKNKKVEAERERRAQNKRKWKQEAEKRAA